MENTRNTVEKLIKTLSRQKQTVSFAESCTGGRIAAAFTA
ncbi:CinA family protein, partial [Sulfurovum sp.]